jgi:N-acetylglucosaminyl-diphospho-decaprenol L-rhamnosyltransferase
MPPAGIRPQVSVIVLNYNGARWLDRCLASVRCQALPGGVELLLADNASPDGSAARCAELVKGWSEARFFDHGANLGFSEGNNRPAREAQGEFLLFLNNDAWLEPGCLAALVAAVNAAGADAAMPLVLDYADDTFQTQGFRGIDLLGWGARFQERDRPVDVFSPDGCAYFIRREVFLRLGGFDREFFMYAEEFDLSYRLWLAGYRAVGVREARVHHRGAANVNPDGGAAPAEIRTSDSTRHLCNRNILLLHLKCGQHVLLLLLLPLLLLLLAETAVGWLITRRWSFVRRTLLDAGVAVWRLRGHVRAERRRLAGLRRRSDWALLRFVTWRLQRFDEVRRIRRLGLPKVAAR